MQLSNRLTFSLASLIVLIALGFIATPAMAASFADSAAIADVSVVQGTAIDITFPTATNTETQPDPVDASQALMAATLTPTGVTAISPSAADPPEAETSGTLQGLIFTFDPNTGVGKLTGNASPAVVPRVLVTYEITESDGADADTDAATPVSLVFAFEVRPQTDMLTFGNASISDKELTEGNYFYEVLPAAQDGIGPLTYSIAGVTTEAPADSGIFTGGNLPAGLTFVPKTRVLSGTPSAAASRAVLTYTVADSTVGTAETDTIAFTIEVKARVNGPMFAAGMTKVPDAAYTEGHAIEAMTLPEADTTNALGSVTYALTGLPTGTGLSFNAATRMLTGTPSDKDQAASPIAAMYTVEDQSGNDDDLPFQITVNGKVTVTAPANVTGQMLGKPFTDITVAAATGGTGDKTVVVSGLPAGLMQDDMKITGDPTAIGTTTVTITATDSLGAMGTDDFTIEVEAAPTLTVKSLVAPQVYTVGEAITPMLLPEGSGGIPPYTYALTGLPDGINFDDATRILSGEPTEEQVATDYMYTIADSAFSHVESPTADHMPTQLTLPINITVMPAATPTDMPPTFGDKTIAKISATAGTAITAQLLPTATDPDNNDTDIEYSLDPDLPDGLEFDMDTRLLSGTPDDEMEAEVYTYTATSNGKEASLTFIIEVAAASDPTNMPPTFGGATIATVSATADTAITAQLLPTATDPDGDDTKITYSLTPPAGLMFATSTRLLSGTPTTAQEAAVYSYTATDEGGATASLDFIIQVAATTPGVPGNVMATADQDANTIALSWDAPSKTGGKAITSYVVMMNGTAVPDDNDLRDRMYTTGMLSAGDYAFTVAAKNSEGTGTASDSVSVTIDPEPVNPTVTIAGPADLDLSGLFTATLTFSEAVPALTADDLTVTGGSVVGAPGMDTTTTDGTVWTVVIQPNDGVTEVVIAVSDTIASGTLSHTIKPPEEQTTGDMLAAGAYRVIVGSGFSAATLPGVTAMTESDFPADLAAFFIAGGTVDVVATGGDVIINEFMVARDTSLIGSGNPTEGQWIELYNRSTTEAATITAINFHQVSPAPAQPDNLVDRLSNVVGQGWDFQGHLGAEVLSGNPGDADTAAKNFISIRRKEPTKDGWVAGHWERTPTTLTFAAARVGTPGAVNAPPTFSPTVNRTPARSSVTISEVANRMDDSNEWIELKGPAGKSLKNWKLSIATAVGTETPIFTFPNNDNIKISDNGRLLLTDQNPTANELAADYADGVVTPKRYKNAVVTLGALPNDGHFVLILRSNKDKTNHEAIEDIAGSPFNGDTNFLARAKPYTTLWPLTGNAGRLGKGNKLTGGKVYVRVRDIDGYSHNKDKPGETAFAAAGWTGIGYDRNAAVNDENGGTPGYPKGALQSRETTKDTTAVPVVIINEIMYATGPRSNMPQWIELYNPSKTVGINMDGWRLTIINHDEDADGKTFAGDLSRNYAINSGRIPPGQTFLLTAYPGRDDTSLPRERVYDLPNKKRGDLILSQYGFEITLLTYGKDNKDENRKVVDKVGNLAEGADSNVRGNPQSYVEPAWMLPVGTNDEGDRISIVRASGKGDPIDGQKQGAWTRFDMSGQFTATVDATSYGHSSDIGSPGHTVGGVLPVSLSKFRPERLDDGTIAVRWITESELDNAGFNILRSDTRTGEFTKLNAQLIEGQGTTSERTAYEFVDKTAKPNVVYYYQIQDVSLDGDVQTLRTTRLKGHVSPAGKATTTWGELKALQ